MSDKDIKDKKETNTTEKKKEVKPVRRRKKGSIGFEGREGKISKLGRRYAKNPDYKYHVFNDDEFRIHEKTEEDDWDFVKDENGEVVKRPVGTKRDGSVQFGYLAKKRKEWHDEDKALAQKELDDMEKELLVGTVKKEDGTNIEADNLYIPKQNGKQENIIGHGIRRKKD